MKFRPYLIVYWNVKTQELVYEQKATREEIMDLLKYLPKESFAQAYSLLPGFKKEIYK